MTIKTLLAPLQATAKKFGFGKTHSLEDDPFSLPAEVATTIEKIESASSIVKVLSGSTGIIEEAYFPPNVIGGTCPRVAGEEELVVWNAAAEACDSERVHIVWQTAENKLWYLAVHSGDLA